MAQVYHAARQRGSTDGYRPYTGAIRDAFGHVGHPKLRQHLEGVVMLMKYSPDWRVFMDRFDKEYSQWGANYLLPFPDDYTPPKEEAGD